MQSVLFLRSQEPSTDSRLQRYLVALKKTKVSYGVIGWYRGGSELFSDESSNQVLYGQSAPIGGGKKNIVALIKWNMFLLTQLWKKRKSYTTIHAVDFDTCVVAYIFSRLFHKRIIIDIYDKYTDSRDIRGSLATVIDFVEKFVCGRADVLILPDECRINQLKLKHRENVLIVENVPLTSVVEKSTVANQSSTQLVVSYVGILEKKHRGLEHLLSAVSNIPEIKLVIAGAGPLEGMIRAFAEQNQNICFLGAVDAQTALQTLNDCNLLVGMYYKTVKNHLYASPNKYYEHLMLGKAMLTTEGTPPGDKVSQLNTGFAIGESEEEIRSLLLSLDKDKLNLLGSNARAVWESKYNDYLEKIESKYVQIL